MPPGSSEFTQSLFDLSADVRYVAIYRNAQLQLAYRPGAAGAGPSESDRYEELIVNPTLLTLVRQRGDIDCGGIHYVLVRYGDFFALVLPLADGHVTVSVERDADPVPLARSITERIEHAGF